MLWRFHACSSDTWNVTYVTLQEPRDLRAMHYVAIPVTCPTGAEQHDHLEKYQFEFHGFHGATLIVAIAAVSTRFSFMKNVTVAKSEFLVRSGLASGVERNAACVNTGILKTFRTHSSLNSVSSERYIITDSRKVSSSCYF